MPSAVSFSVSAAAAWLPASSRSQAISTCLTPCRWNAARMSSVKPPAPWLTVTLRSPRRLFSYPRNPAAMRVPGRFRVPAYAFLYVPLGSPMGLIPVASALPLAASTTKNLQKLHTDSTRHNSFLTIYLHGECKTDAPNHHHVPVLCPACTLCYPMYPFRTRRVYRLSPSCHRSVHLRGDWLRAPEKCFGWLQKESYQHAAMLAST